MLLQSTDGHQLTRIPQLKHQGYRHLPKPQKTTHQQPGVRAGKKSPPKENWTTGLPRANPLRRRRPAESVKPLEKHQAEPEEEPYTLVEKATRKPTAPRPQTARRTVQKPAAALVKVATARTYADTLRAVRDTEIDFEAMGTHVTSMRKTIKGDLLVELTKGAKATAATLVIRDKLVDQAPTHRRSGDHGPR